MLINLQYVLWESIGVIVLASHHFFQAYVNDLLIRDVGFIYVEVNNST